MSIKKEREEWILNLFFENFKDGVLVKKKSHESPDFIVEFKGKIIGIEVTEIYQDSYLGLSKLKQNSMEGAKFTQMLIDLLKPDILFTYTIGVHFNDKFPIKQANRNYVLNQLVEICLPAMKNLSNHQILELENYYNNLPCEIESVIIVRFDGIDDSIDHRPEGGIVSQLELKHLNSILTSKEKKLANYLKCDEQWLLIREGNYFSGSFSSINIDSPIESQFDKVYLLRTRTNEIIQLK